MKLKLFFCLIIFFLINNILYSTDELEDYSEKMKYFRLFFSNEKFIKLFNELIHDGYVWKSEVILFGSEQNNAEYNGQAQFNFQKLNTNNWKGIYVDFVEIKGKNIIINNIYYCNI